MMAMHDLEKDSLYDTVIGPEHLKRIPFNRRLVALIREDMSVQLVMVIKLR